MISLYCDTLLARQEIISSCRTCPPDLQTPVCSILFAAHAINIAEVINVRKLLLHKFGQKIICHCADLKCTHPKILENLSASPPPAKIINYHMNNLAQKYGAIFEPPPVIEEPVAVTIHKGTVSSPNIRTLQSTKISSPREEETSFYKPTVLNLSGNSTENLENRFSNLLQFTEEAGGSPSDNLSPSSSFAKLQDISLVDSLPAASFAEFGIISGESYSVSDSNISKAQHGALSPSHQPISTETTSKEVNVQSHLNLPDAPNTPMGINLEKKEHQNTTVNENHIIMSLGSANIHVGFHGEKTPRYTIPFVIGRPTGEKVLSTELDDNIEYWVGNDALELKGILKLTFPMENGKIRDWEDLIIVWRYIFNLLCICSSQCSVSLSIPEYVPKEDQEEMKRIFWNEFNVQDVFVLLDPLCIAAAVYGNDHPQNCLIVDAGASALRISSVIDSSVFNSTRFIFGGYQAESFLARLLQEKSYTFSSSSELQIVKKMKDQYCYIAQDYQSELQSFSTIKYTLPDGELVFLGEELFKTMEAFFEPKLLGIDEKGLHHQILLALLKCPNTIRRTLLENIILVGGTSLTRGFPERLAKSLTTITPKGTVVKLVAKPDRQFLSWLGAHTFV